MISEKPIYFSLSFPHTNESLESITNTLSIKESDKVLSICGCGAQPLALLNYLGNSGSIMAVDYNPKQIKFAKEVIGLIKEKRINELEELNITPKNIGYFSDRDRLKAITKNLDKLKFKVMDVSERPKIQSKFNKGYFSNAPVNLEYFYPFFERRALVYVAFHTEFLKGKFLQNPIDFFLNEMLDVYGNFKTLYDIDLERTERALTIEREHTLQCKNCYAKGKFIAEQWMPFVLMKK